MPERAVIEGQTVLVIEPPKVLPGTLDLLLRHLVNVTYRVDPVLGGTATHCDERTHRLALFRRGRLFAPQGELLDLELDMCIDCGAVKVRDVSRDSISHHVDGRLRNAPRLAPRRRNETLGWYTGARRRNREYHAMSTGTI